MRPDLRIPSTKPLMHQRRLPPGASNYVILAPPATHFREARSCEEAQCSRFVNGWETHLDVSTASGLEGAEWIRSGKHGNQFSEWRAPGSTIVVFRFPPYQPRPFGPEHAPGAHLIRVERPEWFGVRHPENGYELKLHQGAGNGARDWVDDFAENQALVAKEKQKG